MRLKRKRVLVDPISCAGCGFCLKVSRCRSPGGCVGCLACFYSCPYEARYVVEEEVEVRELRVLVDGVEYLVPEDTTVAEALKSIGYEFGRPGAREPSLACGTGGCWACALVINGSLERSCITPVEEGMRIETDVSRFEPRRIAHGADPHTVGGKATPWWEVDYLSYVEAAIWVAGCNLRCPQCQNFAVTYDNVSKALTPREAARELIRCHLRYGTRGVAVSGGEPTIHRRWLVSLFRELSKALPRKVRKHLDSNGTLLTPDYIDELVEAGCNNIGVEPKCFSVDTYMRVTGLEDRELASRYLNTAWRAVEYINEYYPDKVYLGVGLIYNPDLITLEELAKAGDKLASINPEIQVTVLDYFPAFRRRWLRRPTVDEMLEVKKTLEDRGLKCVIVQTIAGHVGPGNHRRIERVG